MVMESMAMVLVIMMVICEGSAVWLFTVMVVTVLVVAASVVVLLYAVSHVVSLVVAVFFMICSVCG